MDNAKSKIKLMLHSKDVSKKIYNQDKTLILVLTYKLSKKIPITYNYKIIDAKSKEEIKEGVFTGTSITWFNNTSLKCVHHVGMIKKDDESLLLEGNTINNKNNFTIVQIN